MKKLSAILLALLLLSGCGGSKQAPEPDPEPTSAPTAAPVETPAPTEAPTPAPTEPPKETVIVDNDQVTFTITGTHVDRDFGYTLDCFLENKTDTPVLFTMEDVSVDDFMNDPFWAARVPGGKKAKESVTFCEVKEAGKVEFTLLVMPEDGPDSYDYEGAIVKYAFTYEP